ncbi:hypothetical protein PBRA_005010 [Plasmodiophora brassicae]|uniref:ABC transporter domain-containing protein n=1 Tax=Plasmodiophora brassicae TaxID=37360 RepID=A0A0G4IMF7_PLABS|nr:hypothetical protein PBRA_005010 [Plasmodiophora brassicae]
MGVRRRSPLLEHYVLFWVRLRPTFIYSIVANYVVPLLTEIAPWYLSRRKIAQRLRQRRTEIEHQLIKGGLYSRLALGTYIFEAMLYAALVAVDQICHDRIEGRQRAIVYRLVMQRILHGDIGLIQRIYKKLYDVDLKNEQIAELIDREINGTIGLVNTTMPAICRGGVALYRQVADLYARRQQVDILAIIRPVVVQIISATYARFVTEDNGDDHQVEAAKKNRETVIDDIIENLPAIQCGNLQDTHLDRIDAVNQAICTPLSLPVLMVQNLSRALSTRGIIDFAYEVVTAKRVMHRSKIDHQTYRTVQNDVDYAVRLAVRLLRLLGDFYSTITSPCGITSILTSRPFAPSRRPSPTRKRLHFNALVLESVVYRYKSSGPFALDIHSQIRFEKGRVYALAGPNGSGKSTLLRIIMKLLSPHKGTRIMLDSVPFEHIDRSFFRDHISYLSHEPYLVAGTIIDNIRIAKPTATEMEIEAAAEAAGVFLYDDFPSAAQIDPVMPRLQQLITLAERMSRHPVLSQRTEEISGGLSQAVALARVFLRGPSVRFCILDEALMKMDALKKHQFILPRLLKWVRANGATLLIVSHDPNVFNQADHIVIMERGRVVAQGSPRELSAQHNPVYERLCGAMPQVDAI